MHAGDPQERLGLFSWIEQPLLQLLQKVHHWVSPARTFHVPPLGSRNLYCHGVLFGIDLGHEMKTCVLHLTWLKSAPVWFYRLREDQGSRQLPALLGAKMFSVEAGLVVHLHLHVDLSGLASADDGSMRLFEQYQLGKHMCLASSPEHGL